MEQRISAKTDHPNFKNPFNEKHFVRAQSYKVMLIDARYFMEANQGKKALECVNGCLAAIDTYQTQIKLADGSPAGWELVDRLGLGDAERDIKKLEATILEERKNKKKKNGQGNSSGNNNKGGKGGPCPWCASGQHSDLAHCRLFKSDVDNKRAKFDSSKNEWVKTY